MNYPEAEQYILGLTDYEKSPGVVYTSSTHDLHRVHLLLEKLGNPHLQARSAHVAGTKGKGSTTAMIASALTACGYKTGLYTSPHFWTMRERIRVDGTMISEADFASAVAAVKPKADAINRDGSDGQLTTFEIMTAAAFLYFARQGVQYQVLEVGLGGRLDATNVVHPDVCVITSISLDHTEVLGRTLAEIAAEKAGIVKPGCTVVSADQADEVEKVITDVCAARGARLLKVGKDITWLTVRSSADRQSCRVQTRNGEFHLTIPLLGEHQLENAACAVAALEVLASKGATLPKVDVQRGFAAVNWPGRLQVLRKDPWLICDGAHNVDSAAKLVSAIRRHFIFDRGILVIGISVDKDVDGMVQQLAPGFQEVIVARSKHPRSAPPEMIAGKFESHGFRPKICSSVLEAIEVSLSEAKREDLICITGSLFVVGEALTWRDKAKV